MDFKWMSGVLMALLIGIIPAFSQEELSTSDIVAKMKTALDLQDDQITNITPIIEKYEVVYHEYLKSVADNTINPSAIDSQRQGIEDSETQDLSQYLKPNQISEWRDLQHQLYPSNGKEGSDGASDQYSNLPGKSPGQ